MKRAIPLVFSALVLVAGCENKEQTKQIEMLETNNKELQEQNQELQVQVAVLQTQNETLSAQIEADNQKLKNLEEKINEKQSRTALVDKLRSRLDALDRPISRLKAGVSYRDFSGVHGEALEAINLFERDGLGSTFPEIATTIADIKLDFASISSVWEKKFQDFCGYIGGQGVCHFVRLEDSLVKRYQLPDDLKTEYGWSTDSTLIRIIGAVSARSEEVWEQFKALD